MSAWTAKRMDTLSDVEEWFRTFRLDTAPKLGDGGTGGLDGISQFACMQVDVPSTDGTNNASVSLHPTDRLEKFVSAIRTWKGQSDV